MITYLGILISNLLELTIFYHFHTKVFKIKRFDHSILYYVISFVLKSIINIMAIPQLNLITALFIYLILLCVLYKGNLLLKIFAVLFLYSCALLAEVIAFILLQMLSTDTFLIINSPEFYFFGVLMSKFLQFIFVKILANILSSVDDVIHIKDVISFMIMPIAVILLVMSMGMQLKQNIFAFLSIILLLISILLTSYFFTMNIRKEKLEAELRLQKQISKNEEQHYLSLKEKSALTREFRHNLKHYLAHIDHLLNVTEYEKVKHYIKELRDEFDGVEYYYCGNPIIDLVLSSKREVIHKFHIELNFEIEDVKLDWMKDIDKNVIFGNVIDNAIESCTKVSNPIIKFQIRELDNYIVIRITNSCKETNKDFKTLKNDKKNHGYGLQRIQRCVKKYQGNITYEFNQDNHEFITKMVFPNGK